MNEDIVTTNTTGDDGPSDATRREFLKRSAVAGAVVWSAPAIASLPGGRAWAQDYDPCPGCAECDAQATAVNVLGIAIGQVDSGCDCGIGPINQTVGTVNVKASVACAKADDDACTASTYLENVEILVGSVPLLGDVFVKAQTLSSCVSCGTGDSYVLNLAVHVGTQDPDPLVLSANCNGTPVRVTVGGIDLADVVFNEQVCAGGTLTVNALRVTILGTGDVIVGQSKAGGTGCACTACSSDPACTAPRSELC